MANSIMRTFEHDIPIYKVAELALAADGKWTVTYVGTVTEQGGNHFGRGQLTFQSLKDAVTFMEREVGEHIEYYRQLIAGKEVI